MEDINYYLEELKQEIIKDDFFTDKKLTRYINKATRKLGYKASIDVPVSKEDTLILYAKHLAYKAIAEQKQIEMMNVSSSGDSVSAGEQYKKYIDVSKRALQEFNAINNTQQVAFVKKVYQDE